MKTKTSQDVIETIATLRISGVPARDIVGHLNRLGLKTANGHNFDYARLMSVLMRFKPEIKKAMKTQTSSGNAVDTVESTPTPSYSLHTVRALLTDAYLNDAKKVALVSNYLN